MGTLTGNDTHDHLRTQYQIVKIPAGNKGILKPGSVALTRAHLDAWFRKPRVTARKGGPGWVPGRFNGEVRDTDHLIARSLLTIDYDSERADGTSLDPSVWEDILARLDEAGWDYLAHPSFRHTPEKPKVHIVLFPSEEIPPDLYGGLWDAVTDRLGGGDLFDIATRSAVQFLYDPRTPSLDHYRVWSKAGATVPLDLARDHQTPVKTPSTAEDSGPVGQPTRRHIRAAEGQVRAWAEDLKTMGDGRYKKASSRLKLFYRYSIAGCFDRDLVDKSLRDATGADWYDGANGTRARDTSWESAVKAGGELPDIPATASEDFADILDNSGHGLRGHQRIAEMLAEAVRPRYLSIRGLGWHYWNGVHWQVDEGSALINEELTEFLREANTRGFETRDKDLVTDVRSACSASGTSGVLALAATKLLISPDRADADPYVFNCRNGAYDLRTSELLDPDPSDYLTRVAGAAYHEGLRSEEWETFLQQVLPDPEVRRFLQKFIGVSMLGKVREQLLVILTGTGRNGKGVFVRVVSAAFGDYADEVSNDLLTSNRGGHKSAAALSAMMQLRGLRLATLTETDQVGQFNETQLKYLTGGDKVSAKFMGKDQVSFTPSHSLLMSTNHLPSLDGSSPAVVERIRVIPFDQSFASNPDKDLEERLTLHLDAVLAWAVEGYRMYQEEGFAAPTAVTSKTEAYVEENDPVKRFLNERCVRSRVAKTNKDALRSAYIDWAAPKGELIPEKRVLTDQFRGLGLQEDGGRRNWMGIGLKDVSPE